MERLKLVSTKVPGDWVEKLNELTEATGKTQSAIVREVLGQYLGFDTDSPVFPVDAIQADIAEIKARLTALESESRPIAPIAVKPPKVAKSKPRVETPGEGQAMNADELHKLLTARGYTKGIAVLRRSLVVAREKGELPTALVEMGVTADFEGRAAVGDKVKARWLFISEV